MSIVKRLRSLLGYSALPKLGVDRGYVIGTGWWCDGSGTHEGAQVSATQSDEAIRGRDFFRLWLWFINKYTNPDKIIVADSASPVRPELPEDPRIEFLSMKKNWGHFVGCDYSLMCGVERAHLAVAFYALLNDSDLIYVEQDCLVAGEGWVDECYRALGSKQVMFGAGKRTPQPIQQSLALVRWEYLPVFINRLLDQYVRHRSILLSSSPDPNLHNTEHRWRDAFARDVCHVPFGYGRARPIDFSAKHIYAQHWTEPELRELMQREGLDPAEWLEDKA